MTLRQLMVNHYAIFMPGVTRSFFVMKRPFQKRRAPARTRRGDGAKRDRQAPSISLAGAYRTLNAIKRVFNLPSTDHFRQIGISEGIADGTGDIRLGVASCQI
jgi:hypothetical protein